MLLKNKKLKPDEKQLIALYSTLSEEQKGSVLDFAAFLASDFVNRSLLSEDTDLPEQPHLVEVTKNETVVTAIKRLSQAYPMLDRSKMLDATSSLMSAHILQGEPVEQVIEKLQDVFLQHYEDYVATFKDEN